MTSPYAVSCAAGVTDKIIPVVVWARGVTPGAAETIDGLDDLLARAKGGEAWFADGIVREVRDMLRHGRYKPTGRGKPASEFLWNAALRGEFPRVNGPVDVNNAISLSSGYPGSIFDAEKSGPRLRIRYGTEGESYVFNPSGQSIDLADLVVVCREAGSGWEPCGNPVKDAMVTKIHSETQDVVGVLYVPRTRGDGEALAWGQRYADMLAATCRARDAGCGLATAD